MFILFIRINIFFWQQNSPANPAPVAPKIDASTAIPTLVAIPEAAPAPIITPAPVAKLRNSDLLYLTVKACKLIGNAI